MRMMPRRLALIALACLALMHCGKQDPPPSPSPGPSGDTPVSGGERLGWSQQASTTSELGTFRYAIYVDGVRSELAGVSCGNSAGTAGFECSGPLPSLSTGPHTIELTTFIIEGTTLLESARSSSLRVTMAGLTMTGGTAVALQAPSIVVTSDRVRLHLSAVAEGLRDPVDVAFGPGGAIFVAERGGFIRIIRDGAILPRPALDVTDDVRLPAGGLLALALDPQFARSGIAYTLHVSLAGAFTVARHRVVGDTFGERAILLESVAAVGSRASGALRFGPDGKLYVALDDGADGRAAGNLASYNGKILRLNPDGTTPGDQAALTPIFSLDHPLPGAFDWRPSNGDLWVVDEGEGVSGRISALRVEDAKAQRATVSVRYALPDGIRGSSAGFYRGTLVPGFLDNLFIAAGEAGYLIRIQLDPQNAERILSTEHLLDGDVGMVQVVAAGSDGGLYVASDTTLYRLAP